MAANGRGAVDSWRGKPFILPNGMTRSEMESRLYALPARLGAFYADRKTPIGRDTLLGDYRPVPIDRDGVYRWVDANGNYALGARGGLFELDVRRAPLPGRPATSSEIRTMQPALPSSTPVDPNNPYARMGLAAGAARDARRK